MNCGRGLLFFKGKQGLKPRKGTTETSEEIEVIPLPSEDGLVVKE